MTDRLRFGQTQKLHISAGQRFETAPEKGPPQRERKRIRRTSPGIHSRASAGLDGRRGIPTKTDSGHEPAVHPRTMKIHSRVTPAEAGVHTPPRLGSRVRGNDDNSALARRYFLSSLLRGNDEYTY
jgi:hypothetical protein